MSIISSQRGHQRRAGCFPCSKLHKPVFCTQDQSQSNTQSSWDDTCCKFQWFPTSLDSIHHDSQTADHLIFSSNWCHWKLHQIWGQIRRFSRIHCVFALYQTDSQRIYRRCKRDSPHPTGLACTRVCSNVLVCLHMQKSIWRAVDKASTPLYHCERKLDGRVWDEPFSSPIATRRLQGQYVSGSR